VGAVGSVGRLFLAAKICLYPIFLSHVPVRMEEVKLDDLIKFFWVGLKC